MKESFDFHLKKYNKLAKKEIGNKKKPDQASETVNIADKAIGHELNFIATRAVDMGNKNFKRSGNRFYQIDFNEKIKAQKEIFNMQVEKQKIMDQLHLELADLDNKEKPREKLPNQKEISQKENAGEIVYAIEAGDKQEEMSLGEIMTDGEWGNDYFLNESVPRNIRKQFIMEKNKRKLRYLYDLQIMRSESTNESTHVYKREAYKRMKVDKERQRSEGEANSPEGIIAEKMVRNFLKRITFDYPVNFKITEADAFADMERKCDFFVETEKNKQGVKVKTGEEIKKIGIQYTTNKNAAEEKEKQIARAKRKMQNEAGAEKEKEAIEDIVLVVIPLDNIKRLFHEWQKEGQRSGGPDKLWDKKTKEQIFIGVMAKALSEKEARDIWSQIEDKF